MKKIKYKTREDILKRAQDAIGIPMKAIDKTGRIATGKGSIGTIIEESWFGYSPNNNPEPDFPEAGVELKVTPYLKTKSGIRAKERLICNIINYMTEYKKTFKTSDFWHKCETMLIMLYEYNQSISKDNFSIDKAILFNFPIKDLIIIEHDWCKIISKIKSGKAHLITEGDTLYLAACPKGKNSQSLRKQPFSQILAMQRAYSLKASYVTQILKLYVFGNKKDENIIKDWHELQYSHFEDIIVKRLSIYYGLTQEELKNKFSINSKSKNINELLLSRMLGINGKISKTEEFKNASIVPKTIRLQFTGHIKESMSFPAFSFTEIIKETWETSQFRNFIEPTKFMFVIFREVNHKQYVFEKVFFWNIPAEDLKEVKKVWEKTVQTIKDGVQIQFNGKIYKNNLPKQSENRVSHVRPHARNNHDTSQLPDGRKLPKQCFWLNRSYIEDIIFKTTK